jgi:proteasome assembly chaperone (PAC2) family protein
MGNVAVGAAAYMVKKLSATLIHELPSRDLFDLNHVEVKQGVARPGRLPRNMFFEWRDPTGKRDLLIFIGEGQPNTGGFAFCQKIMEYAIQRGAKRVLTFAAMATQLHPTSAPRVFGATTDRELLEELKRLEVQLLREGQISGLNGVLLAAAAERSVAAISLLGELPFFAVGVPNPKASQAVLESVTLHGRPSRSSRRLCSSWRRCRKPRRRRAKVRKKASARA